MVQQLKQYWHDSSVADKIFGFFVILFFSFAIIKWEIALKAYYLCALVAIIALSIQKKSVLPLDKWEWSLISVVVLLIAYNALAWWVNDMPAYGDLHVKSRLGKLIFFIPIFLYVRKNDLSEGVLLFALISGVSFAALHALIFFIEHNYIVLYRVGADPGFKYALITASFTAALAVVGFRYLKYSKLCAVLILLSLLAGAMGILLASIRGVWLALFVVVVFQLALYWKKLAYKKRLILIAVFLVAVISILQVDLINNRLVSAYKNTVYYFVDKDVEFGKHQGTQKVTSVGTRLELWRLALRIGGENPVFGISPAAFRAYIDENHEAQNIDLRLRGFEYPHNDYLAALTAAGIPGMLLHIALLLLPWLLFWRYWQSAPAEQRHIAVAGMAVVLIYMVSCLTYDHLHARYQICAYAMLMGLLLGKLSFAAKGK